MTTPSKTWTRSREPSTTRTETRTVSPGPKSGRSCRRSTPSRAARSDILKVSTREAEIRLTAWTIPLDLAAGQYRPHRAFQANGAHLEGDAPSIVRGG